MQRRHRYLLDSLSDLIIPQVSLSRGLTPVAATVSLGLPWWRNALPADTQTPGCLERGILTTRDILDEDDDDGQLRSGEGYAE
jgi:hypothetical protein